MLIVSARRLVRLIRVAPISHLLCGLLALSSASLHRLVSQSTRNMIDWLGFLLRLPIHYKFASCLWRSRLQTPALFYPLLTLSIRHMLAPRVPAQPQASLCLPTSLALPTSYFAALIARANRVCPTLGVSFSCLHALMPFVSARHSVALPCAPYTTFPSSIPVCATLSDPHKLLPWPSLFWPFEFPTCLRHACLPDAWLAFVFLQAWQSPCANLQPAARVPIVSARRLVRLSLAFPASLRPLYPPNVLFVSPQFHSYFAFPTCGCHSCLWAACAVLCTLRLQSP